MKLKPGWKFESSNDDSSEEDKKLAPRETQLMPKSAPKVNLKTEVKTDTNANEREKAGDGNGGWMEDIIKSKPKCTSCEWWWLMKHKGSEH